MRDRHWALLMAVTKKTFEKVPSFCSGGVGGANVPSAIGYALPFFGRGQSSASGTFWSWSCTTSRRSPFKGSSRPGRVLVATFGSKTREV